MTEKKQYRIFHQIDGERVLTEAHAALGSNISSSIQSLEPGPGGAEVWRNIEADSAVVVSWKYAALDGGPVFGSDPEGGSKSFTSATRPKEVSKTYGLKIQRVPREARLKLWVEGKIAGKDAKSFDTSAVIVHVAESLPRPDPLEPVAREVAEMRAEMREGFSRIMDALGQA